MSARVPQFNALIPASGDAWLSPGNAINERGNLANLQANNNTQTVRHQILDAELANSGPVSTRINALTAFCGTMVQEFDTAIAPIQTMLVPVLEFSVDGNLTFQSVTAFVCTHALQSLVGTNVRIVTAFHMPQAVVFFNEQAALGSSACRFFLSGLTLFSTSITRDAWAMYSYTKGYVK